MSRALIILSTPSDRAKAQQWVSKAPVGSRIEFKAPKRSLDQNSLFWSRLTDVACQKEHFGRKYTPEVWKALFMRGWQKEIQLIPSLDGREVVPLMRSSDLSKQEMTELLDFIAAWGAEQGVIFHDLPAGEKAA